MAIIKGKDGTLTLQATDAAGDVTGAAAAVGQLRSWEINEEAETKDSTVMGVTARRRQSFHTNWSASVEALFDPADGGQALALVGARVEFVGYPGGNASGRPSRTGFAIITSDSEAVEMEDFVMLSLELEGDGALTRGSVA